MLRELVESVAFAADRPIRPLLLQALLQLPRLADARGSVPFADAEVVVADLARELPAKSEWPIEGIISSPRELHVHTSDKITALHVMQRFHYLRSPRVDGRAYALSTPAGRLVALCVSSPIDVNPLVEMLTSHGRANQRPRVISRVFAFEGAPSNSISYMLSRVAREERRVGVTDFVTYVNPNLGFSGSSYKASGWRLLGIESTKYRYIDNRYLTDREIVAKFGAHDDNAYEHLLGNRFAVSVMPLRPLLVFHTRVG
jgi:hypothetical protein